MTDSPRPSTAAGRAGRPAILAVYLTGFLQGLAIVSFPASAAVLKDSLGLTDAGYGALFLPQVALAVIGSLAGAALARRLGLKRLLVAAQAATGLSMLALAASAIVPAAAAFPTLLVGTAFVGLGFGIGGAPLNALPPVLFPRRGDAAVLALHTLLGLGLAGGPLLMAPFVAARSWAGFPLAIAAVALTLLGASVFAAIPASDGSGSEGGSAPRGSVAASDRTGGSLRTAPLFWVFAAIAVLYAFAEGTFANWAVVFLHEGIGASPATAGLGLSVFWGAIVVGRLLASILVLRIPSQALWLVLPVLMGAAFLLLPTASATGPAILLFGLAGLGCSAFFPLTITLASRAFPGRSAAVSSMMIAALMIGVGAGTFVFGPLRELLTFGQIYRLSVLYPAGALLLAAGAACSPACRRSVRTLRFGAGQARAADGDRLS